MANMSLKKNPMPSQEPQARAHNFEEVALGYSEEQALDEAQRCLNCKNYPCVQGCPVNIRIPQFIANKHDVEGIRKIIGADSLGYISVPGLVEACCKPESELCLACVTGRYPTRIDGEVQRFQSRLNVE